MPVTDSNITIYNTLTRSKAPLEVRDQGKVSIYACGLTPQGPAHLGHMRGAIAFDAIRRWLKYTGYEVRMIQNFTDIDDKIIRKSHETGLTAKQVAEQFEKSYLDDWDSLGIERVEFVKVTENMDAIVALVEELVSKSKAYATEVGDVYFSVASDSEYGKLSGRTVDEMEAGARIEISADKRAPMDFALWKAAKPGEPSWPSPWGQGRPGWHIECSALALKYLGNHFDIHAGGIDLIFPHHENEIAQSEAATGDEPFAKVWAHWGPVNAFAVDENGRKIKEKMSKSLGNFFAIQDVLATYEPDIVRLYVLSTHYRSPIDYVPERLAETAKSYERLKTALSVAAQTGVADAAEPVADYLTRFGAAMNDDFNTAHALGIIFEAVGELNKEIAAPVPDKQHVAELAATARTLLGILGFSLATENLASGSGNTDSSLADLSGIIERAIVWRQAARAAKQYALSDQIRDDLGTLGIIIEDRPQGTTWRRE